MGWAGRAGRIVSGGCCSTMFRGRNGRGWDVPGRRGGGGNWMNASANEIDGCHGRGHVRVGSTAEEGT